MLNIPIFKYLFSICFLIFLKSVSFLIFFSSFFSLIFLIALFSLLIFFIWFSLSFLIFAVFLFFFEFLIFSSIIWRTLLAETLTTSIELLGDEFFVVSFLSFFLISSGSKYVFGLTFLSLTPFIWLKNSSLEICIIPGLTLLLDIGALSSFFLVFGTITEFFISFFDELSLLFSSLSFFLLELELFLFSLSSLLIFSLSFKFGFFSTESSFLSVELWIFKLFVSLSLKVIFLSFELTCLIFFSESLWYLKLDFFSIASIPFDEGFLSIIFFLSWFSKKLKSFAWNETFLRFLLDLKLKIFFSLFLLFASFFSLL